VCHWTTSAGLAMIGHVHKRFFLRFRSPYWSPTTPPITGVRIEIYFAFCTFLRARYGPDFQDGGGSVCQTDDVGQGGGPKSQFLVGRL